MESADRIQSAGVGLAEYGWENHLRTAPAGGRRIGNGSRCLHQLRRRGQASSKEALGGLGVETMSHIFISHVEKDADIALGIALGLEQAGFRTWCYETDSVAGVSYLLQTKQAIERSSAVVLVISAHSLGSNQVTKEVVRAHESGKPFVPVLRGTTHAEFQARQPEWREAIGAATSIVISAQGVAEILPRIADGLKALGIRPTKKTAPARLQEIRRKLDGLSLSRMVKPPKERSEAGTLRATRVSSVCEAGKGWGSRPVVRLAAVFVASTAVVILVVLVVAWLTGGSEGGSSPGALVPTSIEGSPAQAGDVPVISATASATTTLGAVSVGDQPVAVAVNSSTNRIYVVNIGGGNVSVIDGDAGKVVATIVVGDEPSAVAVNPTTNRIYVANSLSDTISVIDGETNSVVATVTMSAWYPSVPFRLPWALSVNPATNRIYVASNASGSVSIVVIDGGTNTLVAGAGQGGRQLWGVAANPATNRIYAADDAGDLWILDGENFGPPVTLRAGSDAKTVGAAVAVNPATNRIYLAETASDEVSVIDGATDTVVATIAVGDGPINVAVNAATNRIYVANLGSDTLSVIDGATNAVVATIPVGDGPFGLAVNPNTNRIYVGNSEDDTVSVITGE